MKSTKAQRDALRQKVAGGHGFLVYDKGNGEICEFEFYLDRNNRLRTNDGQLVQFEVNDDI